MYLYFTGELISTSHALCGQTEMCCFRQRGVGDQTLDGNYNIFIYLQDTHLHRKPTSENSSAFITESTPLKYEPKYHPTKDCF